MSHKHCHRCLDGEVLATVTAERDEARQDARDGWTCVKQAERRAETAERERDRFQKAITAALEASGATYGQVHAAITAYLEATTSPEGIASESRPAEPDGPGPPSGPLAKDSAGGPSWVRPQRMADAPSGGEPSEERATCPECGDKGYVVRNALVGSFNQRCFHQPAPSREGPA